MARRKAAASKAVSIEVQDDRGLSKFMRSIYKLEDAQLEGLVEHDSRICFGVFWCTSEKDADLIAKAVEAAGDRYNGGWFDGCRCGREPGRDYTDDKGVKWHAVTTT